MTAYFNYAVPAAACLSLIFAFFKAVHVKKTRWRHRTHAKDWCLHPRRRHGLSQKRI